MSTLGGALAQIRRQMGCTQVQFASLLGVSQTTVSAREADTANVPASDLQLLAKRTGMTVVATELGWSVADVSLFESPRTAEPVTIDVSPSSRAGLRIFGDVGAGGPATVYDEDVRCDPSHELARHSDYLMRVHGDSMEPLLLDGDIIGVSRHSPFYNGDVVVLEETGDNSHQVKVFWGERANGTVVFGSYNPTHQPEVYSRGAFRVIGTVWGVWRPGHVKARAF